MYESAIDTLTAAGYEHYEVSNFARPGHRCLHNENYWLGGQYFAAGPGAARFIDGRRETNHRSTTTYISRDPLDSARTHAHVVGTVAGGTAGPTNRPRC